MTIEEALKVLERVEDYVGIHYINGVEDPYINPCLLKAIDFAVAALREQEEREKGCGYCNEDSEGYRKMIGSFSITNPFHGNVWNIETCHCKPRQIYFCPMCGRMLTEPPKGE